jgi:excinuclease ABC subunit B
MTKKSSEDITNFLLSKGYKAFYLHSDIETMDRWEIIQKLKLGEIDILVGVNLLREGIDLPEV